MAPPTDWLIERGLPVARRLARQYRGRRLSDEDLEGEAYLALVAAARKYDLVEHAEESWCRYAERVIRSGIRAALERAPIVHGSRAEERRSMKTGAGDAGPRPHDVAVEDLGIMPSEPEVGPEAEAVGRALERCGETGRAVLIFVLVDGLSIGQAARRLGISLRRAQAEHDAGRRIVEDFCRGRSPSAN